MDTYYEKETAPCGFHTTNVGPCPLCRKVWHEELRSKVRTVRKQAEQMMEDDTAAFNDIDLFYAPRECYGLVIESSRKTMKNIFSTIDLKLEEWDCVMCEWMRKEAESIPHLYPDPPPAYYVLEYVIDLLDPHGLLI